MPDVHAAAAEAAPTMQLVASGAALTSPDHAPGSVRGGSDEFPSFELPHIVYEPSASSGWGDADVCADDSESDEEIRQIVRKYTQLGVGIRSGIRV